MLSVIEPLNLTKETINGIEKHPWRFKEPPFTNEGLICRYADRIAYLSHDVEDAIRARVLNKNEIPKHIISELGKPGSTWINSLVSGVFKASSDGSVKMDEEVLNIMNDLRKFMFEKVYLRDETKKEREEAKKVVEKLVLNFAYNPDLLPRQYRTSQSEIENAVDYVAGMTDRFALKEFEKL